MVIPLISIICTAFGGSEVIDDSASFVAYNEFGHDVYLWMWPKSVGKWRDDKPFVPNKGSAKVTPFDSKRHYLMVKDQGGVNDTLAGST